MKRLLTIAAALFCVTTNAQNLVVRELTYNNDVRYNSQQTRAMEWYRGESVRYNINLRRDNLPVSLPSDTVPVWKVWKSNDVSTLWVNATGTLVSAGTGQVRIELTASQANLTNGSFVSAVQLWQGTNYMGIAGYGDLRVTYSPAGDAISYVGTTDLGAQYVTGAYVSANSGTGAVSKSGKQLVLTYPAITGAVNSTAFNQGTTNGVSFASGVLTVSFKTNYSGGGGGAGTVTNMLAGGSALLTVTNSGGPQPIYNLSTAVATGGQWNASVAGASNLAFDVGAGATNLAASCLQSNSWQAADSTTNYVRRTGDTMSDQLVVTGTNVATPALVVTNGFLRVSATNGTSNRLEFYGANNSFNNSNAPYIKFVRAGGSGGGLDLTIHPTSNYVVHAFGGTAYPVIDTYNARFFNVVSNVAFLGIASGGITNSTLTINATELDAGTNITARLDSNTWATADSTTNYVPRTGGGMSGGLTNVSANGFVGNGVGLTNISVASLVAGPAINTYPVGNGVNITNVNAKTIDGLTSAQFATQLVVVVGADPIFAQTSGAGGTNLTTVSLGPINGLTKITNAFAQPMFGARVTPQTAIGFAYQLGDSDDISSNTTTNQDNFLAFVYTASSTTVTNFVEGVFSAPVDGSFPFKFRADQNTATFIVTMLDGATTRVCTQIITAAGTTYVTNIPTTGNTVTNFKIESRIINTATLFRAGMGRK